MPRRKKTTQEERPPEPSAAETNRQIAEDFQERQDFNVEGSDQLAQKLRNHNSLSPELSAGDVDAAWDYARESGEETLGGHAPTPDQDRVDDLGAAAGLTYKDDEPLHYSKVSRRDERRWELDARSGQAEQAMDETEAEDDEDEDEDDQADDDNAPLRFWDLADDLDAEVEEEYDDEDEDEEEDDEEEDAGDEDEAGLLNEDEDVEADAEDADAEDDDDEADDDLLEDDELDSDLEDVALDDLDDDEEDDYDDDDD